MDFLRVSAQIGASLVIKASERTDGELRTRIISEGAIYAHVHYLREKKGHRYATEFLLRLIDELEPDFNLPKET